MLIGFVSDPHIGNHRKCGGALNGSINVRAQLTIDTFKRAIEACVKKNVPNLIVNGDIFDVSNPPAQMLATLQVMLEWGLSKGTQCVLLMGNHDSNSNAPMDNALAPLRRWAKVYDEAGLFSIPGAVEVGCLPFRVGKPEVWVPEDIEKLFKGRAAKVPRLLSVHSGIRDNKTAAYLQGSGIEVSQLQAAMQAHGITHTYAGDWHDKVSWVANGHPKVYQCGTLCPTGWSDQGFKQGRLFIHDTTKVASEVEEVLIPGPRFVTVTSVEEAEQMLAVAQKKNLLLFARMKMTSAEAKNGLPEGPEGLAGWEVVVTEEDSKKAYIDAAASAKSAETMEESLLAYVNQMPLPAGVEAEDVAKAVREILTRARKSSVDG